MTEVELLDLLQSGENIPLVARHISIHPEMIETLMNIVLTDGTNSTWRAAWIADKIHEHHPELIVPYLQPMIDFVLHTTDSGKKRHLLKLVSLHAIPEAQMARLLHFCMDTFTNTAEPIAVRVHAMQILFNIAQKEPDFSGELIELIEHEIECHFSSGLAARGRKLLRKLFEMEKQRKVE
ncbi:MAG TPA: hypothetical protein VF373_12305 [Prolixibacteraceae bacterium]